MQRSSANTQPTSRSSSIVQSFRALGFRSNSINPQNSDLPSSGDDKRAEESRKGLPPAGNRQRDLNGNQLAPRPIHKSVSARGKKSGWTN